MTVNSRSRLGSAAQYAEKERHPLLSDNDINTILVNGAQISLSKLKRAQSFDARLYYYAEIGVYLEVSLSRGAGILDATREQLQRIHTEATHLHMDANKTLNAVG
ncbi:excinuclease ABC subunit C [Marinobacterium marinum]|uniref:Excinuclease ABC subunit C n=1 Tax=Marinobacterium marinum TaxID=2756129 RepID=A0A7W1WY43_9GAMM|nr:excinuclease ABC subunit C [Marinobacterium marinum]MBA4502283.1 excinuclease ABC subunit C [Marinobacterium marinum]